ncbi:hypothetical protein EI94DRAFT_1723168 [Lactarius quietus]|nr:hypothetical protein EI94DRAFT_1723168 [Lactarius quietus]
MFRISTNWRSGRCRTSILDGIPTPSLASSPRGVDTLRQEQESPLPQITLAGKYTIISSSESIHRPSIVVLSPSIPKLVIHVAPIRAQESVRITALAVDQSSRTSTSIAACISNGDIYVYELRSSSRKHHYAPPFKTPRTAPISQAAYSHPVLVTLSENFSLSVYDLSHEVMQVQHVLTSFTSFPPSSLVLTIPEPQTYKLLLTYASPVYPAHWSVGVTEVILSSAASHASTVSLTSPARPPPLLLSTRSTRAFDLPADWIDETKLRNVREQWGRKVGSVASTQTDGRWVVLAPAVSGEALPLQLYRFRAGSGAAPKLTFVRNLLGQAGPVSALALADGRCVSLGVNGSVWVWDLENGRGTEVTGVQRGTIAFDERKIITSGAMGSIIARDFDI